MNECAFYVLYDGSCKLCRCSKLILEKLDRRNNLIFVDVNDARAMRQIPQIDRQQAMEKVTIIAREGRTARGFDGIVLMLEAWRHTRIIRWVLRLWPIRWIGRWIYHLISINRHRINFLPSCGTACNP